MCTPIDIRTKDIAKITGKSYGRANIKIKAIRAELKKLPHQMLTIAEVAEYLDVPEAVIIEKLKEKPQTTK